MSRYGTKYLVYRKLHLDGWDHLVNMVCKSLKNINCGYCWCFIQNKSFDYNIESAKRFLAIPFASGANFHNI